MLIQHTLFMCPSESLMTICWRKLAPLHVSILIRHKNKKIFKLYLLLKIYDYSYLEEKNEENLLS